MCSLVMVLRSSVDSIPVLTNTFRMDAEFSSATHCSASYRTEGADKKRKISQMFLNGCFWVLPGGNLIMDLR